MRFSGLLDSGAYSVYKKGGTIDIEKYAAFCHAYKETFRAGVFNLDVIGDGEKSYQNWKILKSLGVDAIPIYHNGTPEHLLTKYMDETDFIGIGAIARLSTNERLKGLDHLFKNFLNDAGGTPRVRAHGLGLTSLEIMIRYPWHSVDSAICANVASYGSVMLPRVTELGVDYDRLISTLKISDKGQHVVATYTKPSFDRGGSRRTRTGKAYASFYGLPERTQRLLSRYIEAMGCTLHPQMEGHKALALMAHRKKQRGLGQTPLFDIDAAVASPVVSLLEPRDTRASNNVSNSWHARYRFNLKVAFEFVKYWQARGKTVRWYHVVVNSVFDTFLSVAREDQINHVLVSYFYLENSRTLTAKMQEVFDDGHRAQAAGRGDSLGCPGDGAPGIVRAGRQAGDPGRLADLIQ